MSEFFSLILADEDFMTVLAIAFVVALSYYHIGNALILWGKGNDR